jgi:integrase
LGQQDEVALKGSRATEATLRSRILRPAARGAGLEGVGFHAFRHTCASLLFSAGKDLKQVQHWLGHHDPAFTLSTYIHLLDDGLGDANFLDGISCPDTMHAGGQQLSQV